MWYRWAHINVKNLILSIFIGWNPIYIFFALIETEKILKINRLNFRFSRSIISSIHNARNLIRLLFGYLRILQYCLCLVYRCYGDFLSLPVLLAGISNLLDEKKSQARSGKKFEKITRTILRHPLRAERITQKYRKFSPTKVIVFRYIHKGEYQGINHRPWLNGNYQQNILYCS